jgi:hypothetical protein
MSSKSRKPCHDIRGTVAVTPPGSLAHELLERTAIDGIGVTGTNICLVYKVFAKWADDGSLWHAFVASVAHLSAEKQLDLRVLHGDGTNTVAKKGGMALATRATSTKKGRRSSP